MAVSIKEHGKFLGTQNEIELKRLLTAVLNDNAAMRAAFVGLTAKLDASTVAGLESDYAATLDPVALELTL